MKKTQGRRALKNGGGSLAVGSYLQRGSAPPPPGQMCQGRTNCTPGATTYNGLLLHWSRGEGGGGRSTVTLECLRSVLFQSVRLRTVIR